MSNESIIQISAETSGVERGVRQAERSLNNLANAAQRTGNQASGSLNRVGDAATSSAQRQERASRSIERSLQREIALLQAGERGSREYYESLARQRGIDPSRFNPLLQQLDQLRQQTDGSGASVAQFNAALRTVPAQLTDVVTQLVGGQSPFLVLLQQGGQLRDSFGGFTEMFQGLGTLATPTKLALGGVAAAIGATSYAAYLGNKESRDYQNTLTLMGDSAGVTALQLQHYAAVVGNTTQNYGIARDAVLAFAKEGSIASEDYVQFARTVSLMSEASGKDVSDLVAEFTKIGEDPVKSVVELSKTYKSMTAEVYAQVVALKEQGKEQEAVRLIQQKMATDAEDMAKRVTENLGWIEKGWKNIKDAASGAWESIKEIGRDSTFEQQIAELDRKIKGQHELKAKWGGGNAEYLANLEKQRADLVKAKTQSEADAKKRAEAAEIRKDSVSGLDYLRKEGEAALPTIIKLRNELAKVDKELAKVRAGGDKTAIVEAEKWAKIKKADINEKIAEEQKKEERKEKKAEREATTQFRGTPMARLSHNQKRLYELAKQSGEDPAKWLALYQIESRSGNDLINERSGATGHFQIMPQFFRDYRVSRAEAMDLATSFHAVRRHHARASASLRKRLGRDLTAGEYYLGHQQGWGGATALLSNPNMNAVDALATIMSRRRARAQVVQNGGRITMTARQFAGMWVGKANKLQQQFGSKGIGSLDSASAGGLYDDYSSNALKKTDFEKYQEQKSAQQLRVQIERELRAKGEHRVIDNERDLRSRPEFVNWTKEQQNSELAKARAADELATQEKNKSLVDQQIAQLTQKQALIGKNTEMARLQYEMDSGSLKHLSDGQKAEILTRQQAIEAAQKQYDTDKKYGDLRDSLAQKTNEQFTQKAFELSLVGKSKAEIEKLTLAREYDLHIMQATADGASAAYIDGLQQQKIAAEEARLEFAKLKQEHDGNWVAGISDGLMSYVGSFKSMREEVSGLVEQTTGRMADSLAEFVATGKGSFREFSQSVLEDISKMMIKMAIFNAMKAGANAMSGAGAWVGAIGSAAFRAFWDGGYTGHGGKFEPAGIVHKGEYVLSQEKLRALGGVGAVEGLIHRAKGYSNGGLVGGGVNTVGLRAHAQASSASVINITVNVEGNNREEARQGAEEGVQAGLRKMISEIADSRIFEQCRPGNVIYQTARG